MNNSGTPARPGNATLPPLHTLIRPEMIQSLPYFPEGSKAQYRDGVTKLWAAIDSNSPDSPEYQKAHKKLAEVSNNIRKTMSKGKQEEAMTAQQNGARPMSSDQPSQTGQQDVRPINQGSVRPQNQEFSAQVVDQVRRLQIVPTPQVIAQGQEAAKKWVSEAQHKYAQRLHELESWARQLRELDNVLNQRQAEGRPLNPQETEQYNSRRSTIQQSTREIKEYLMKFSQQQQHIKAQRAQSQAGIGPDPAPSTSQDPNASSHNLESKSGLGNQPPIKSEPPSQPHTVSSAVDAARNQANPGQRSAMSPQNNGQVAQNPPNQPPTSRPPPTQNQTPNSHPPLNVKTNSRPTEHQHESPHVVPSQPTTSLPQEPVPLSHQAAMEQARSYSHPNVHQSTPQSASHGHPPDQRNNNHAKMPIPKDLNVNPPQPVSMGPSRPTLTNGPVAMGPMGQPAIQKHPGYVLEGEGERVLSKKKLEELVRQVTGGTGGEGEEGEGLTAEVEETLLQVADEFVDQVIVAACRLAKLRQSSTLELRDLQLILERNYNIRVPGYASDELRTVKKIIPAQAWTQKLSAVQAAKVTGGKTDL